jgi:aminopeptidase-like protein
MNNPMPASVGRVSDLVDNLPVSLNDDLYEIVEALYPFCRSLTGNGVRATLDHLGKTIDLNVHEVPTGTPVLDWLVPREWNIRDAWIADKNGKRVVDFRESNLHVLGYSIPVREHMTFAALREHLYSDPNVPNAVPYRTSYWVERWGFCLTHETLQSLIAEGDDAVYEVVIDSTLSDGFLSYAEAVLPGETNQEILVHAHTCHPSLANDNCSGMAAASIIWRLLSQVAQRRYTYRFVFLPGTIGPITWLSRNREVVANIAAGIVLSNVGDRRPLTFKRSQRDDTEMDRAAAHILSRLPEVGSTVAFSPFGYDERQYCSPGFDLAVGCLSRGIHGTFPEYHTSLDDCSFVDKDRIVETVRAVLAIFSVLEGNRTYQNTSPFGEPQLGRRGLYRSLSGMNVDPNRELALLWVLNQSNGVHSLLDIATRADLPFKVIREAADLLIEADLLSDTGA